MTIARPRDLSRKPRATGNKIAGREITIGIKLSRELTTGECLSETFERTTSIGRVRDVDPGTPSAEQRGCYLTREAIMAQLHFLEQC